MAPLRVLILPGRDPYGLKAMGGAESSMRLIAEALAARGHEVVVAADAVTEDTHQEARARAVRLLHWPGAKGPDQGILALWRIARSYNVQVVYVFYDRRLMRTALRLRRLRPGLRVAVRMAGLRWAVDVERRPSLRRAYERMFNAADAVNFIHPALEAMTQETAALRGMILRFRGAFAGDIGSSAPVGRGSPYSSFAADGTVEVVMPARFSDYQKRQDLLIEAMALLPNSSPLRLTMIGEGRRKDACATRIAELGLGERVRILPFESQSALWERLETAQMLALATEYEGLGKIVIEAMALGLPVAASDVRPLRDYIVEGRTGFLVTNTPAAWAKCLDVLAGQEGAALRQRVSDAAIAHVRRAFDPAKNVALYENAFRALLANRSCR